MTAARRTKTRLAERSERHNVFRVATTEGFALFCKATGYAGGYLLVKIREFFVFLQNFFRFEFTNRQKNIYNVYIFLQTQNIAARLHRKN